MSNSVRTMTIEEVQKVLERKNHEIRLLTAHIIEQNSLIEDLRSDLFDAEQDYEQLARDYDQLDDEFRELESDMDDFDDDDFQSTLF